MAPITATTEIARPADDVFAYATDPSTFAEWQKGVVSGHTEIGQGSAPDRCVTVRRIGFADRANTSEVVHCDPPLHWRVRGIDGPIRAQVDVTVEPLADDRSGLNIAVDFEGHGIGKILVPLIVQREARDEMPANIAALKARLENPT
jgi:Polyketide cyclase / dehydrase and lipid transport